MTRIRRLTFLPPEPPPEDVAQALYKQFYDRTLGIVTNLIGDRECAIEATQEAFVRALERFGTLRDRDKFGAWIASIALNAARDILRRRHREIVDGESDSRPQPITDSVEETVIRKESALSVQEAIAALPPLYKTIILLHYVAERDIAFISKALGMPEGTVKSRLYRGRALLRQMIECRNETARRGVL